MTEAVDDDPSLAASLGAPRAAWLWQLPRHPRALVDHLLRERVEDVFLGVPWSGPEPGCAPTLAALKGAGIRVHALGGEPQWAQDPLLAREWAERLGRSRAFDGVHLDVEPWASPAWPGNEATLLAGLGDAVGHVRDATGDREVEVDLPAWLAVERPEAFLRLAADADAVTVLAYRDRATAILAFSSLARQVLAEGRRSYRIGVDTTCSRDPGSSFFDDGRAVLQRESGSVERALGEDVWFRGMAVHDVAGWQALRP
ncbi:MAG TPA: hypothetical protein DHV14_12345 [Micrococcales bacterium]|uniref:Uncharacterized protein n=1 Tax=Miniimonas arenae TaxID=676201 RepID=A0A5C5BAI0_9MICO|nr:MULTISPECIES: hypothetical protein [Miniimonas]TNU72876.1 hypothetical protein FH969_14360 [Miniimonas arenae]HCX85898.1 hypothetical protein [Micrococcales bacterium]